MDNVTLRDGGYNHSDINLLLERYMSTKKPEWVTLGEAAKHVSVTRETLRRMIHDTKDKRIPDDCWQKIPVGSREYYQIDLNCLDDIEFGSVGRPPTTEG